MNGNRVLDNIPGMEGINVQAVPTNAQLARQLRNIALMVDRGEILAGVFVGCSPQGITSDLVAPFNGPGDYALIGCLQAVIHKLSMHVVTMQKPVSTSPIVQSR